MRCVARRYPTFASGLRTGLDGRFKAWNNGGTGSEEALAKHKLLLLGPSHNRIRLWPMGRGAGEIQRLEEEVLLFHGRERAALRLSLVAVRTASFFEA